MVRMLEQRADALGLSVRQKGIVLGVAGRDRNAKLGLTKIFSAESRFDKFARAK